MAHTRIAPMMKILNEIGCVKAFETEEKIMENVEQHPSKMWTKWQFWKLFTDLTLIWEQFLFHIAKILGQILAAHNSLAMWYGFGGYARIK